MKGGSKRRTNSGNICKQWKKKKTSLSCIFEIWRWGTDFVKHLQFGFVSNKTDFEKLQFLVYKILRSRSFAWKAFVGVALWLCDSQQVTKPIVQTLFSVH